MLRGTKPLAMFSDVEGHMPEVVMRYLRLFDRHVAAGTFIKRDHRKPTRVRGRPMTLHTILYALPDETWRIDAMIELRSGDGWSLECERREGELLGYADWQNDWWIGQFAQTGG